MKRAALFPRSGNAVAALATALSVACGSSQSGSQGSGGAAPVVVGGNAGAPFGGAAGVMAQAGAAAVFTPLGGTSSAGAPAGAAGACHKAGEPCGSSLECCDGSTCNNTAQAPSLNGCHPRCTQNADCQTGCCLLYTGDTRGICTDAMWCGCGMSGARCGSDQPKCCADQLCLAANAQQSSYECKKRCTTNADCPTNCCVAIPNLGANACLDPMYCPAPAP